MAQLDRSDRSPASHIKCASHLTLDLYFLCCCFGLHLAADFDGNIPITDRISVFSPKTVARSVVACLTFQSHAMLTTQPSPRPTHRTRAEVLGSPKDPGTGLHAPKYDLGSGDPAATVQHHMRTARRSRTCVVCGREHLVQCDLRGEIVQVQTHDEHLPICGSPHAKVEPMRRDDMHVTDRWSRQQRG